MRAQFIYEKFIEDSDPIHDLNIGDPLHVAGGYLQKYADENGYHFEMKKISGKESPIIIIDLTKPYFDDIYEYPRSYAALVTKLKYSITYMPHHAPRMYSLRKGWIGYRYIPDDDDYEKIVDKNVNNLYDHWKKWREKLLLRELKKGYLKEVNLKQGLMGRFTKSEISEMIRRINVSIKNEMKKK